MNLYHGVQNKFIFRDSFSIPGILISVYINYLMKKEPDFEIYIHQKCYLWYFACFCVGGENQKLFL